MANSTSIPANAQLAALLAAASIKNDRDRQARRLAEALMRRLYINPQGIDVICFVADARHRTNAQAMQMWVNDQLDDLDSESNATPSAVLDILACRLRSLFTACAHNDF